MITTRAVAYRLASAPLEKLKTPQSPKGSVVPDAVASKIQYPFLEVSQKKIAIPNPTEETVKGPIRLRLLRLPAASAENSEN